MDGHIHDSAIQGSVVFGFVLLFGLAWRLTQMRYHDKAAGKAMAIFY